MEDRKKEEEIKIKIPKIKVNDRNMKPIYVENFRENTGMKRIGQKKRNLNKKIKTKINRPDQQNKTPPNVAIPDETLMKPPEKPPPKRKEVPSQMNRKPEPLTPPIVMKTVGGIKTKYAKQNDIRNFMTNISKFKGDNNITHPPKQTPSNNNNIKGTKSKSGRNIPGGKRGS